MGATESAPSTPETQEQQQQEKQQQSSTAVNPAPIIVADRPAANHVTILYGSTSGTAEGYAIDAAQVARALGCSVSVMVMNEFEPEDLATERYVIMIVPTYMDGTPPKNAAFLFDWLQDADVDVRVSNTFCAALQFTVFGLGDSVYDDDFNVVGRLMKRWVTRKGARLLAQTGEGDSSSSRADGGSSHKDFTEWLRYCLTPALERIAVLKEGEVLSAVTDEAKNNIVDSDDDAEEEEEEQEEEDDDDDDAVESNAVVPAVDEKVVDLEDMGGYIERNEEQHRLEGASPTTTATATTAAKEEGEEEGGLVIAKRPKRKKKGSAASGAAGGVKEEVVDQKDLPAMITDKVGRGLTKQGYKLIGTHSGVKLCRWTKAMLRGRGGCYKHTFYGIQSYQCMEMTPSLACANKCVFCWRAHTNPVGKKWNWKQDDPKMLVDQAIAKHRAMIKTLKGVPGVLPERFKEAMNIRHCALSLVGEPIMYPEINTLLRHYHDAKISTFMVTNAQFPEKIETLEPVTQLYVSIDGSTQESLKRIDRPLFKDFWPRFQNSLKALRHKKVRTVYRLTLVSGFNMEELAEYAKLLSLGWPCFIEIKGVTFCGTANGTDLSMKNVPFHQEVRNFATQLCALADNRYEIASEHAHSCCILLADTKYKIEGKWHTHIDYEKFHELAQQYYKDGIPFDSLEYCAPTPDYAVFGSKEEGFDPEETRFVKKKKANGGPNCDPETGLRLTAQQVYVKRQRLKAEAEAAASGEGADTTAVATADTTAVATAVATAEEPEEKKAEEVEA